MQVLVLFCLANPAYLVFDAIRLRSLPSLLVVGRVLAEVILLGSLLLLLRSRRSNPFWLLRATCCAAAGCWLLVTAGAGGSSSAYFAMLPAIPLIYVASFPEDPVGALLVGATDLVGGLALMGLEGRPRVEAVEWGSVAVFLGVGGFLAGLLARARTRRELAIETSRREAVERLALSEKRRATAERLAGIGQLAAGVAHEINNPLSYVRSNLRALAADIDGADPEARQLLGDTLSGVSRIAEIVSDLGAFARNGSDAAEECHLAAVVEEAIRLASFRFQGRATVLCAIDPVPAPPISLPRGRLVQALVNLLVNAADAVEQCPTLVPARSPAIRIRLRRSEDHVELEVEDNGPGPSPLAQQHLFEPFFTTKGPKGTGLGLAISKENVERCGGTLELQRGQEGGARFVIRIPTPPGSHMATEEPSAA